MITSAVLSLVLVPALYHVVYRMTEARVVVREGVDGTFPTLFS